VAERKAMPEEEAIAPQIASIAPQISQVSAEARPQAGSDIGAEVASIHSDVAPVGPKIRAGESSAAEKSVMEP
jgi:hypothetical protein